VDFCEGSFTYSEVFSLAARTLWTSKLFGAQLRDQILMILKINKGHAEEQQL
jgi:hypothetical protein